MAKSEYFKGGIVEMLFRWYHAFPVVRHTADRAALKRSFDLLKAGHALIIYPEGTRVESGVLAKPEPGAGFIAQKAGCPVLPVGLSGTRECLPKGAHWPRRVPVERHVRQAFLVASKRPDGTQDLSPGGGRRDHGRDRGAAPDRSSEGAFSDLANLTAPAALRE